MVGATEEAGEAVRTGLGLARRGTRRWVGGGSSTRENIPLNCDSMAWGRGGWGAVSKGPSGVFVVWEWGAELSCHLSGFLSKGLCLRGSPSCVLPARGHWEDAGSRVSLNFPFTFCLLPA